MDEGWQLEKTGPTGSNSEVSVRLRNAIIRFDVIVSIHQHEPVLKMAHRH